MVGNEPTRLVAIFKDYLLLDDINDFLKKYYPRKEIHEKLQYITSYYGKYCTVFPNYFNLEEKKYLYKNIIRKQRMLNERHEDMMRIKFRAECMGFSDNVPSLNQYINHSKLFTSKFLDELKSELQSERSSCFQSGANSNFVDYSLGSVKSSMAEPTNNDKSSSPVKTLNKDLGLKLKRLLDSFLNNDTSIESLHDQPLSTKQNKSTKNKLDLKEFGNNIKQAEEFPKNKVSHTTVSNIERKPQPKFSSVET